MKKPLIFVGVVAVAAIGAYLFLSNQNGQNVLTNLTGAATNSAAQSQSSQSHGVTGLYCMNDGVNRTLVLHQEKGSPEVTFGVSYWFPNTRHCGVSGATAKLASDQKWIYQTNMQDGSLCELSVTVNNGSVEFSEGGESCSDLCGAGMKFETVNFPAETRIQSASKEEAMQANELALCP